MTRVQPGLIPSQPRLTISRSNSCERSRSMPSSRWPYGPAHEQPPRDWIPNRSLSSATTKLWWRIAPRGPADDERDDREPVGLEVAEDPDVRVLRPALDGAAPEVLLVRVDHVDADRLLELEDEPGADRLDDRRRAALLADAGVVEVAVLGRADVGDGAAADDVGHAVREQLAPHDEHAGRAGAADELVRAEEDRVLVARAGAPSRSGASRSRRTARRRRSPRTRARRGGAAGRRWRSVFERIPVTFDAAENEPIFSGRAAWRDELGLERREVDVAVGVLGDDDDVGDRLAPRAARSSGARTGRRRRPAAPPPGCARTARSGRRAPTGSRRPRMPISLSTAPVAPEPQKITQVSSVAADGVVHDLPRVLAQAASSAGRCPTTRCACSRSAAAPRRGSRPR